MKRILSIFVIALVIVLLFTMVACKQDDTEVSAPQLIKVGGQVVSATIDAEENTVTVTVSRSVSTFDLSQLQFAEYAEVKLFWDSTLLEPIGESVPLSEARTTFYVQATANGLSEIYTVTVDRQRDTEPHLHQYGDWVIERAATCTIEGARKKVCNCGDVVTEVIPAKHSFSAWTATRAATCSAEGSSVRICTECQLQEVGTIEMDPDVHSFDDSGICSLCGAGRGIRGLIYSETNDGYAVSGYSGDASHVIIPIRYLGKPVLAVKESAFSNNDIITSVVFPEGLTSIGATAFGNCEALISVNIPDKVETIGDGAFSTCKALETLILGKSVQSIGNHAFSGCSSLTSVVLPSSVKELKQCAFLNCKGLISVELSSSLTNIGTSAFGNCEALISVSIPDKVEAIGNDAFLSCKALETLTLGNAVRSIGINAFSRCASLTSVVIPTSVKNMDEGAFFKCGELKSVTILSEIEEAFFNVFHECPIEVATVPSKHVDLIKNKALKSLTITGGERLNDDALDNCSELLDVTIAESVTEVGEEAFYRCAKLQSVRFAGALKSIGDRAFKGCGALTDLLLPDSIQRIGNDAFDGCVSLPLKEIGSLSYLGNEENPYLVLMKQNDTTVSSVAIPSGTKVIYQEAFRECLSMTSIKIPDTVVSVGYDAFSSTGLTSVDYEGDILGWLTVFKSSMILRGNDRYMNSDVTTTLRINGEEVTKVVIPEGITEIYPYAFYRVHSLTSVTIPEGVTRIGSGAFGYCSGLTSIEIPKTVTEIEDEAFFWTKLVSVSVSEGVESIGSKAFYNCYDLAEVTFAKGSRLREIGARAFYSNVALSSFAIPDSVREIGSEAFSYCMGLDSIVIPAGSTIGTYAFYTCTNLTSVTISEGVTSIGNGAFSYCENLASVALPDSLTTIKEGAFGDCEGLFSITIPKNVKQIEKNAFGSCIELIEVCNDSELDIRKGSEENGKVGYYAKHIYTTGEESNLTIRDDCILYADEEGSVVLKYEGSAERLTLPADTIEIRNRAFQGCRTLRSVIMPDSVKSIGADAFSHCTGLTSIVIPDGVTDIDVRTFFGCTELTSVTLPSELSCIADDAFEECFKLVEVHNLSKISNFSLASARQYAKVVFDNATDTNLSTDDAGYIIYSEGEDRILIGYVGGESEPTLPAGITEIYRYAFFGNRNLTSVTIPQGVTAIGSYAFGDCSQLCAVVLGEDVRRIGESAFRNCVNLTDVSFIDDSRLESVGGSVFDGCERFVLKTYDNACYFGSEENPYLVLIDVIDRKEKQCEIHPATRIIADYAFRICDLSSLIIPDSVEYIGEWTFHACYRMYSITIGRNVTSIGEDAFWACWALVEICNRSELTIDASPLENGGIGVYAKHIYDEGGSRISTDENGCVIYADGEKKILVGYVGDDGEPQLPSDISEINDFAFYSRDGLSSLVIPDGVTTIGADAFSRSALCRITIPKSVTSIKQYAFLAGRIGLEICYQGTKEEWGSVSKGKDWDKYLVQYTVVCSDGTISVTEERG